MEIGSADTLRARHDTKYALRNRPRITSRGDEDDKKVTAWLIDVNSMRTGWIRWTDSERLLILFNMLR